MARLMGKIAIVTGGAAGIGRACAIAYAAEGANVVIADVDAAAAHDVVALIEAGGGHARYRPTDVANSDACTRLVAETSAEFGKIDLMHANAGIELCKSVWDTTDEDWRRILDVNLSGAFYCCREAMRDMRRALALEGAPLGIRVNALLPGAIETPMLHREIAHAPDPAGQLARFAEAHPLARMGQPEDVARIAAFIASDDAAFVTGSCIPVDGGLMAALNTGPSLSYVNG